MHSGNRCVKAKRETFRLQFLFMNEQRRWVPWKRKKLLFLCNPASHPAFARIWIRPNLYWAARCSFKRTTGMSCVTDAIIPLVRGYYSVFSGGTCEVVVNPSWVNMADHVSLS